MSTRLRWAGSVEAMKEHLEATSKSQGKYSCTKGRKGAKNSKKFRITNKRRRSHRPDSLTKEFLAIIGPSPPSSEQ